MGFEAACTERSIPILELENTSCVDWLNPHSQGTGQISLFFTAWTTELGESGYWATIGKGSTGICT
jgi:hypothetical protein